MTAGRHPCHCITSHRRGIHPAVSHLCSRVCSHSLPGGRFRGGAACVRAAKVNDRREMGPTALCVCRVQPCAFDSAVASSSLAGEGARFWISLCVCVCLTFCTITTQDGPPLLICRRDAIVSRPWEPAEDIFQPLVAQECAFEKKCADGTLAGFPAPPVASRFSCCNLWWLRFCPHLSSCKGQHLKPVISSGCKPERQRASLQCW